MSKILLKTILYSVFGLYLAGCLNPGKAKPRLVMFVGIDISGSYKSTKSFENSLKFLSHYLYFHVNGQLAQTKDLFVGTIGGSKDGERKTFFPLESFQNKSVDDIYNKLDEIFGGKKSNPYTDFNAFFNQVSLIVKDRKLILRPISIVLLTDGIPDFSSSSKIEKYKKVKMEPLESLSRNITVRLLYTTPDAAHGWQGLVKRKRIKMWTQDQPVMFEWKESLDNDKPIEKQERLIQWIKRNVNFGVRLKRVD